MVGYCFWEHVKFLCNPVLWNAAAIQYSNGRRDAHYNLGYLMIEKGETEEGIVHLAKSLYMLDFIDKQKINYGYAEVYNKIGKILYKNGKLKEASAFFSKAVQIDPNYSEALKNLKILNQMKDCASIFR